MIQRILSSSYVNRVWDLAWPTVVFSLLEIIVGFVDIYFSSFIGPEAVAAIGFSRQIFLVMMITTLAATTGTVTLVAQYYGAQHYERASAVAYHAVLLAIGLGLIFGVIGILISKPALMLLGASYDVQQHGVGYLQILLGGQLFLMINFATNAIFRALGDAKTPLKIAIIIIILNIILSYIFIFGFGPVPAMGVPGVALGTIASRAIAGLFAIIVLNNQERNVRLKKMPLESEIFKGILKIGLPNGFSGFFRNFARIIFFGIIASTAAGTHAVAAATIGFQFRLFAIMPALAFQVACASLVGQSIGSNEIKEAEKFGWTSIRFCSSLMAVISLLVFIFPEQILNVFTDSPDVLEFATITMRCIAIEQFCSCVSIVCSGVLAGSGDTKPIMRYTLIAQWYLMLPSAYILASYSGLDVHGAWLAWGFAPIIQMLLTLYRVTGGQWKTKKVSM